VAGLTSATVASAANQPTVSQVQTKVNQLSAQYDRAAQQYDQVSTQLTAAKQRLAQINKQVARDQAQFKTAHAAVAQIAASAYEDSGSTSLAGLLTATNPTTVLNQASMMLELAGSRNSQTLAYLTSARQLASVQAEQQHTEMGIQTLADQKQQNKNRAAKLLSQEKATLDSLTAQQQQQVATTGSGGTTTGTYTGPTTTQAEKAVAFAYSQLGCTYYYGGTGPCHSPGWDCSGLVQAAWASAGITIPRDTYQQWAALPHVSSSNLQIGDLLYFNGIGHVAIYVGNGEMIDAPTQGIPVEKVSMNEPWYTSNLDGAARP
jgi:cell wall-associated NlpC family hydrolase/outer membrane murein-binding lipoprotein Lpp